MSADSTVAKTPHDTAIGIALWSTAFAWALWLFMREGMTLAGAGYVLAMLAITACVHFCMRWQRTMPEQVIRQPAKETAWLLSFVVLSFALTTLHFTVWADKSHWPVWGKLLLLAGFGLLTFQGAAVAYVWLRGYRGTRAWGFNPGAAWIALPCIGIMAACTLLFAPEKMLWSYLPGEEFGSWTGVFFNAILGAALVEEFLRYLLQTRLRAIRCSPWVAILITSVIWSLLHVPVAMKSGDAPWWLAMESLRIVPLGLAWGYLTWRTGGWVPAFLLHATNLWGLQNISLPQ